MLEVKVEINEGGKGAFLLEENNRRFGEMQVGISDKILTVYHTEVVPEMEGKGGATKLVETMVEYARTNKLKVLPLCPYVLSVFKKHSDKYEDVWHRKNTHLITPWINMRLREILILYMVSFHLNNGADN